MELVRLLNPIYTSNDFKSFSNEINGGVNSMIKYNSCIRCDSRNVDKLFVNTRIFLNYPEKKNLFTGTVEQRVINPTNALVCRDCGHIELFFDWEQSENL